MRIAWLLLLILIPTTTFAMLECKSYPFLKNGFNLKDFNYCQKMINTCPINNNVSDKNCLKQVLKTQPACLQMRLLARAIKADATMLTIKPAENQFYLVDEFFSGDGQHSYYILTPHACIWNTKIDPRTLSPNLEKQYKNMPFFIVNWGPPSYKTVGKNEIIFNAKLRVTKACLACPALGWAHIKFEFLTTGQLKQIVLDSFSSK